MAKHVFIFRGGVPETPEAGQQMMADWAAWLGGMGAAVLDPGSVTGPSEFVGPAAEPTTGYMLVDAPDLAAARSHAEACPIRDWGGSVEVATAVEM